MQDEPNDTDELNPRERGERIGRAWAESQGPTPSRQCSLPPRERSPMTCARAKRSSTHWLTTSRTRRPSGRAFYTVFARTSSNEACTEAAAERQARAAGPGRATEIGLTAPMCGRSVDGTYRKEA